MKRVEIYIDNTGSLALTEFKNYNSPYERLVLKGRETYDYIRKLASHSLIDLCEYKFRNDVLLEYENCVINLNEYDQLLNKRGLAPLLKNIKDFKEKETLESTTIKKVTRKNKYDKRRIVASGLAVLVLGGCALGFFKKDANQDKTFKPLNSISKFDNDSQKENNKLIFEDSLNSSNENSIDKTDLKQEINKEKVEVITPISISYEDRSLEEKVETTKNNYWNLINKYAKQYGLDPNLVLAIATQEKGIHSSTQDRGGATGLMQIQNGVWENEYISAYNFDTNSTEKIYVTKQKISDLDYNIKFGCMYFQNCLEYMNYNVVAAVQCYNMGKGNMDTILKAYSKQTNRSKEQILNDEYDLGWLDYRYIPREGDPEYIENVFSWLGEDIELNNIKNDNSIIKTTIKSDLDYRKIY